jgi:hypothetical protein
MFEQCESRLDDIQCRLQQGHLGEHENWGPILKWNDGQVASPNGKPPNADSGGRCEPHDAPLSVETERRVGLRLLSILDPTGDADLIAEIAAELPSNDSSVAS